MRYFDVLLRFMKKTIPIKELKIGMYVSGIAKSERNLVVKSQGMIKNPATIETLKQNGILELEIDISRSKIHVAEGVDTSDQVKTDSNSQNAQTNAISRPQKAINFEEQKEAIAKADRLYTQARTIHSRFFHQLNQGQAPDFDALSDLTQDIIDSAFENSDALSCLVMLKDTSDYLVEHALNNSILLTIFAKHKGLSQADVEDLSLAGLLMDCGMALLPSELIEKNGNISEADQVLLRTHVDIGYEIAERFSDVPPIVLDIIKNHHERINGDGYPKQKSGNELSECVQMASIVDTYDELLTTKPNRGALSAQQILEDMQKDPRFDPHLVNEFIEAIGMFPVGSLVALKSGKIGMVVQRNFENPLEPVVLTFYSIRNKTMSELKRVDLHRQSSDKIISAVMPDEFDINLPNFFKKVFVN